MRRSFLLPAASIALLIWGAGQAQVWQEWVAFYDVRVMTAIAPLTWRLIRGKPGCDRLFLRGAGMELSWATLKYNSDGVQQWVAFFRSCDWATTFPLPLPWTLIGTSILLVYPTLDLMKCMLQLNTI